MAGDDTILAHYLAPLLPHLAAPGVTELVVNRPGELAVERPGGWSWQAEPRLTETWLTTLAKAAAAHTAQDVGAHIPLCATWLPSGERCQIVLPPAGTAVSLTLRKPAARTLALGDLAEAGLFDAVAVANPDLTPIETKLLALRDASDWPAFFRLAVASRRNILISGATGSGKTTLAKSLAALIPPDERLLTIEDARELVLPHRNVVHLLYAKDGQGQAQVGPKALLECALRMRPDRILMQELRDESAYFYLRNCNSGHPGSITTIHADSALMAFEQLTLLVKESDGGRDLAREDVRGLLIQLVDIVVQLHRQGGRFRMTEVWYDPHRKRALA